MNSLVRGQPRAKIVELADNPRFMARLKYRVMKYDWNTDIYGEWILRAVGCSGISPTLVAEALGIEFPSDALRLMQGSGQRPDALQRCKMKVCLSEYLTLRLAPYVAAKELTEPPQ